ncbi:MAG: cupin domain-containing protein [Salinivirgaceae bacterium]
MEKDALYWIKELKLKPHPEGEHYAETYKSQVYGSENEVAQCKDRRQCASLIYYLLNKEECSAFHRLQSDEIWLFHSGASLNLYLIEPNGNLHVEKLGSQPEQEENLQVFVPANTWFAAELYQKDSYGLMSCLVSPGFEWNEYELADKKQLLREFPEHAALINRLCKEKTK